MATIEVCTYLDIFKKSRHDATSFQFIDLDTGKVLSENLKDKTNLYKWTSELSDGEGGHYRNIKNMVGRVKFHYGRYESEWTIVGKPYDQTAQPQLIHQCEINIEGDSNG